VINRVISLSSRGRRKWWVWQGPGAGGPVGAGISCAKGKRGFWEIKGGGERESGRAGFGPGREPL